MRVPPDMPPVRPANRRHSLAVLVALGVLLVVILAAEGLSGLYTNFLWFHFSGVGNVWTTVQWTKVGLGAAFVAFAFALCFVSLLLVDAVAPRVLFMASDSELVRRYQAAVGPHAVGIRSAVSLVVALLLGVGTSSQWQHWLLFVHSTPFNRYDPLFHLNASFFVFQLPFLSFLVGWLLVALAVVTAISAAGHFLNGAIRFHGSPRIEPRALAHLSLLLGAMALVRAWGYYFVDRYRLDLSRSGFVQGASYTDIHVRLPAITLLAVVSLAAFAMLVFNAYQRSLVLPAIAIGLWALLAFALGIVYPAAVQALRVNPAQASLEQPSIRNNINATEYAMGIDAVTTQRFPANQDLTPAALAQYATTLNDAQLWDPTYTQSAFDQSQDESPYFRLSPLQVDRYRLGGTLTPVVIGARELNASRTTSQGWVNAHLAYTHGYGAVAAPANQSTGGLPNFAVSGLPPVASNKALHITQPRVYFAPGETGYSVVDTTQREVDYQGAHGAIESHYHGGGGIPLGSLTARLAEALQLKDLNLLISRSITSHSRLITIPDVRSLAQKALPFLTVGNDPYLVIDHGRLEWVLDAYTTSATFPNAESALTGGLPATSALGASSSFNYVRDAVKVVVNAYSGHMRFYVMDPADPVISAWESVFPGMFQPRSAMGPTLAHHLRYPRSLLEVQATMYGLYHVTGDNPSAFYTRSNPWQVSEASSSASGSPKASLTTTSGAAAPYRPIYELLQLPGEKAVSFEAVEPLVPLSAANQNQLQTLSAILFAGSGANNYGRLEALVTPRGGIAGPARANADMLRDPKVSARIAALNQGGTSVSLGTVQILPIDDSLLYVRPLYVSSSQANQPAFADVIVAYGKKITIEPTLAQAIDDIFGAGAASGITSGGSALGGPIGTEVRSLLAEANREYTAAERALKAQNLATYQRDVQQAGEATAQAGRLFAGKTSHYAASRSVGHASALGKNTARRHAHARVNPRGTTRQVSGPVEEPAAPQAGLPTGATTTTRPKG